MHTNWYALAIYLDGARRFAACHTDLMPVAEAVERMQFVHDNIEYCFAEGRLIDLSIFDALDDAADRISRGGEPTIEEVRHLADRLAVRYGFNQQSMKDSRWIKSQPDNEIVIWIDQSKLIAESNRRLFGSRS